MSEPEIQDPGEAVGESAPAHPRSEDRSLRNYVAALLAASAVVIVVMFVIEVSITGSLPA